MTKYRLRLKNGRVIGPFDLNQIHDLKSKGHIQGSEDAQVFPLGDWKPLSQFEFHADLMDENKTIIEPRNEDATFVIDLSTIRQKRTEKEIDKLSSPSAVPTEPLTETLRLSPTKVNSEIEKQKQTVSPPNMGNTVTISQEMPRPDLDEREDKTLLNPVAQEEIQKMRKLMAEQAHFEQEQEEAKKKELVALKEQSRSHKSLVSTPTDTTQMISFGSKTELLSLANDEEIAIDNEIKDFLKKRKEEEDLENEDEYEEEETVSKAKGKKILIIAAALALMYVFLFPEDDQPERPRYSHLGPQIIFPLPFDKADVKKAEVLFRNGQKSYLIGTYTSLVNAGGLFRQSVENNLDDMKTYSWMVRAYGEELRSSKKPLDDSLTLFKIIQAKKPMLIQDVDGVIGMNLFYMTIGKYEAAADIIARYLKLNPKKVTQDLFAAYLYSLIKVGRVDVAKQFYLALSKTPDKSRYALESLIEYLRLNQEDDKAMELVKEGMKKYPNTIVFYLLKCDLLLRKKDLKEIPKILAFVESRNVENNDIYRAKFLEITGLFWAIKGDVKKANILLQKSLSIIDSNDLRMKLAELDTTGSSQETDAIISQSRAAKLLTVAKDYYEKKNYPLAMSSAAKAADAFPGHIPSELFLAKTQMKLGLARESLKTLEALAIKYPTNKDVNLALIDGYTDSYKFNDARNRIALISSSPIRNTWEYASMNARLYLKMGDIGKAISWLKSSINANPMNDNDLFLLAEIYLKRANYPQARQLLNNAMELDPVKPEYRIAYAKLIYETEDDQAAIGYLLGLMNEFGENPKILGEIATFYFRSGKVKDFQDYKIKLEKLPTKDKALYEFLIKAAELDERYEEIPKLVEQLLEIEPGDLNNMMVAGKVLFENGKLGASAEWFKRVRDRLPTYPKVLYYIARIKFLLGEIDDPVDEKGNALFEKNGDKKLGALSLVMNDIKENGESDISLTFLGEIWTKKNDLVKAETYYKKAQKMNSKSFEALVGLADISTKRNNFDLALDLYKRALKQRGDEPVLHRKIGDVYRLLGQGTLAIESYKMYLEADPEAADKAQIDKYINLMQ